MKRAIILILDSLGIGAAADAERFGDVGSNTLGHIARDAAAGLLDRGGRSGPLRLPNLARLGLAHACEMSCGEYPAGVERVTPVGAYGYAKELSSGKDTPSGHWEIAGVPVLFEWGYFTDRDNSFPPALLDAIVARAQLPGYLGNCHASGTEILDRLGEEHMKTGKPIFYTSADSVFQIACHEETFGLERLYQLCKITRELLEPYNIGRVIARPFVGSERGAFSRTGNRKDLAVEPPAPTVLKKLADAGGAVVSVGKISDIYAHVGITRAVKATGLDALWDATLAEVRQAQDRSIVMTNFVDFDSSYGHRRDTAGYAAALEAFDRRLPEVMALLSDGDILILSADHGCDPTWTGTDHTREHIPVLCYGPKVPAGSLGGRETFADIGQSVACHFGLPPMDYGTSFLA
ncbi:MAG: phosphopentomutase [Paludibacterium sp.]|uniref:phosphopentomutase n=1 Tax=Paludibacterium sp. TaxID=1917523 RepID=UPI0025E98C81|nr:phosphopentomutase [Paludibacterium sp.]MBV8047998.1 phosphopentomutase [Paludibacterium sp.]MBV8649166.1 phosphopentomutase [Paludibacterium sp.]